MKPCLNVGTWTIDQKGRSGSISTQLMMFLIFVVFPASWTAFVPVSRIKLERNQHTISVTVRRYMYFIVPYYTQHLTDVSNVRVETYKGEKQGYNAHLPAAENHPNRRAYSADNSELVLSNRKGDEVRAPIDSSVMGAMQSSIEAFLADKDVSQYSASVPANRTLYWLSFPIVLLTAPYVLIQSLAITRIILGNPYWPFSVELANQLNEIVQAHRERSIKP